MIPRAILITGASGGIGSALARAYAAPEVFLALTGRDSERLAAVAAECRARGAKVMTCALDVTDRKAFSEFFDAVDAASPLDLLIANAGASAGIDASGVCESLDDALTLVDVNIVGVLHAVVPAAERFAARGRGGIVLVGSLAALRGLPSCPAYSATKAAVETYGEALRAALKPRGVTVTVVSPGYVRSPMSDRVLGPKPFLIDADRAARIIVVAVRRGRARVAFPWPLAFGCRVLALLPPWVADRVLPWFAFRVHKGLGA